MLRGLDIIADLPEGFDGNLEAFKKKVDLTGQGTLRAHVEGEKIVLELQFQTRIEGISYSGHNFLHVYSKYDRLGIQDPESKKIYEIRGRIGI